ncbi:sugar phosphate nucleotidyltransferase [Finegoldia magna]|uniref:sugar phosphate nucleotidyltransferase n=1 Tax=Finegoldia magna TaxID=1260 RepID=UPI003F80D0CE
MELNEFIVSEDTILKDSIEKLNENGHQILYITNEFNELTGVLSDGDFRRWIIKNNGNIQVTVKEVMNSNPIKMSAFESYSANKIFKEKRINSIPVVDDKNKITTIVFSNNEVLITEKNNYPVVIMAGGKGTRLYPYTKILPKPLIPIGDTPIIERIINSFVSNGSNEFYLTVNYKKKMIMNYFDDVEKNYSIKYIEENEPLGTCGSLFYLKDKIKDKFFVSNCDILVKTNYSDIVHFHNENNYDITIVASLINHKISYGVLNLDENGLLESTIEKPEYSFLVNTGMYFFDNSMLDYFDSEQKIDMPDLIKKAKLDGKRIGVYPVSEKSWLDMGQIKQMNEMIDIIGIAENE